MFGYVTTNMEEMKIKDYRIYHGFYCGVCQDLKEDHGQTSRVTLTYDVTFLGILLTGLYETETKREEHFCAMHPFKKHLCLRNQWTAYAADMNVLLSYYNLLDDWEDEKKTVPLILASALKKDVKRLKERYPRQASAIETYLQKLKACEQEASTDLDRAAADTGEMLGEIYVWKEDVWADTMRKIGCAMGRFIYRMDAYEDIEKDRKKGNYNPWKPIAQEKDFDDRVRQILMMEAAEASRQFEKLPIIEYVDILRNILYSGIWTKYDRIKSREKETEEKIRNVGSIQRPWCIAEMQAWTKSKKHTGS